MTFTLEDMINILIRDKELVKKWVSRQKIFELSRVLKDLLVEEP
jgi:hypothetical protein